MSDGRDSWIWAMPADGKTSPAFLKCERCGATADFPEGDEHQGFIAEFVALHEWCKPPRTESP